jgi:osmotically-inducible protein OsmY
MRRIEMAKYDFNIGAQVHCRDGECGKLHKVVVDPHTQRVTDLIVDRGFLLTTDGILPVGVVERATREGIYLSISSEDLADYPEYREVEFEEPAPAARESTYDRSDIRCWPAAYGLVCSEPVIPMVRRRVHEGISPARAVIKQGTPIRNAQGAIGHIDHLLVDPKSGEVSHLVVRKGLLPYYPIVPISAVKTVSDKAVSVSLTDEEVNALPRYKSREAEDIEVELRARLGESPLDFSGVEMSIDGGNVLLVGWVPDIRAKRRAEAIARSIDGVIDVQNRLDAEVTITTRVMNALLSDPRTSLSTIDVVNERGLITLKGKVDSVEVYEAAEGIAAEQTGVVSVVNALEVEPDDDTEPLRARLMALASWVPVSKAAGGGSVAYG